MKPHPSPATPRAPRPFVFMNMAMTADGKIASANREVSSFGSKQDLENLYRLRATADAVMCGARTADLNKITLGPGGAKYRRRRVVTGLAEYNLRILVSGSGSLDPEAHVFSKRFSPIIVLTTGRVRSSQLKKLRAVADEVEICGDSEIDFSAALAWLREKWSVKRLLCEGGGELNEALFRAGLVDELHLTICPLVFGGRAAPTIADGHGFAALKDAALFKLTRSKRVGEELLLTFGKAF